MKDLYRALLKQGRCKHIKGFTKEIHNYDDGTSCKFKRCKECGLLIVIKRVKKQ